MKVYIVKSEREDDKVFSTKGKAKDFCEYQKKLGDESYVNDGYVVDEPWTKKELYAIVKMHFAGNADVYFDELRYDTYFGFKGFSSYEKLIWTIRTDNEKEATKAVNVRRKTILANDSWGNPRETIQLFTEEIGILDGKNKETQIEDLDFWFSKISTVEHTQLRNDYPLNTTPKQFKLWSDFKEKHKNHHLEYSIVETPIGNLYGEDMVAISLIGICATCKVQEDVSDYSYKSSPAQQTMDGQGGSPPDDTED